VLIPIETSLADIVSKSEKKQTFKALHHPTLRFLFKPDLDQRGRRDDNISLPQEVVAAREGMVTET
jgi:hypothetical protein